MDVAILQVVSAVVLLPLAVLVWLWAFAVFCGDTKPPLVGLPFRAERAQELRRQWARSLGLEEQFTNSAGMKLVLIPGGRFDMGPGGSKRRVTLTKAFYLGATEVTMVSCAMYPPLRSRRP